jgi:hypothetical protein
MMFIEINQILQNIHVCDPKSNAFLNPDLLRNITNMHQPYNNNDFEEIR